MVVTWASSATRRGPHSHDLALLTQHDVRRCRFCDSSLAYAFFARDEKTWRSIACTASDVLVAHRSTERRGTTCMNTLKTLIGTGIFIITASSGDGSRA